jgi:serine/threonine protein kinase
MEHYFGKILHQRYRLTHKIGHGGMATVYLAEDQDRMNQPVVIKQNDHSASPAERTQFEKEAQTLIEASADPQCPRRIPLFHAYFCESEEGWDGQYLVMNYIPGEDLESLMTRLGRPLQYAEALFWLDQVMEVLEFLHNHQPPIFHRDIKPSNIRIAAKDSSAYLVDFGIAGTSRQAFVTSGFSPPEQYRGLDKCDARSDVYALGATLYALVMGHNPPDARARQSGTALPPLDAQRVQSQTGQEAIERALQLDPNQRFSSISEMRALLKPDVPPAPPSLRVVVQPPVQLVMPPTISPRQTSAWWSDPGARMMQMTLIGGNRLITGASIQTGRPSGVKLWEIVRWDMPAQLLDTGAHQEGITCVTASRDGTRVASGDWLGVINVWNIRGNRLHLERRYDRGHRGAITALAFSPDGTLLASASSPPEGIVQLWEIHRQDPTPIVLARNLWARGLAFSPDGQWLAMACDNQVRLWNMRTGTEEQTRVAEMSQFGGLVNTVVFSPNGDLLAAAGADRLIHLFDLRDRKTRAVLAPGQWQRHDVAGMHAGEILHLAFSPNADYLAGAGDSTQVSIWDIARDRRAPPVGPFPEEAVGVSFGAYWYLLVVALKNGIISLVRLL